VLITNSSQAVFNPINVLKAQGGHTVADARHKNTTRRRRRRVVRNVIPAVGVLTLLSAGIAVAVHEDVPAAPVAAQHDLMATSLKNTANTTSRSADRPPLPNEAAAADEVTGHRFAASSLEVHAAANDTSPVLATLRPGSSVAITGKTKGAWAQIMHNDLPRWVTAKDLVKVMPLGTSPCPSGSGMEAGLQPDTIKVHRAVCALFPQVTRYLGKSGGGEHRTGRAVDIMVYGDSALGYKIAAFAQKNARALGISQVIWHQHIWTVQRAGDGWRSMPDRGSATANHMNHVHVSTYGNSATG
jgi:hypothetical protein